MHAGCVDGGRVIRFVVDDPKYVVASVIENGGYGSEGAMYVVRDILGIV